jgi:NDP-sugar pyrophosphorylase family protein
MEHFLRQGDTFLVHYGDILTDQGFTAMLSFHSKHWSLATLLLHQRAKPNSVVSLDAERCIVGFLERPTEQSRRDVDSLLVNSGICICDPEFLDAIPANEPCDLARDIFSRLIDSGRLAEARSAPSEGLCRISFYGGST